jgi:hypothetical protein
MARPLTHPRLLDRLPNFYPEKATIQQATASGNSFGDQTLVWASVSGLVNLDCRVAPLTIQTPTFANEARLEALTYHTTTHQIAMRGYYPEIQETMRALVDNVDWDIKGVEHDGQGVTTRLRVNRVEL